MAPSSVCVSNAGVASVNGVYTYNAGGYYINGLNMLYFGTWASPNWIIEQYSPSVVIFYTNSSTTPYAIPQTGWVRAPGGVDPVPNANAGICPSPTPTPSITPTITPTPSITPTKTPTPTVTPVPNSICISNAGIPAVNGNYTFQGSTYYLNGNYMLSFGVFSSPNWSILQWTPSTIFLYRNSSTTPYVVPQTGWTVEPSGVAPAPAANAGICPSPTPSVTPSITPTLTQTPTITPTITPSITPTRTPTPTVTPTTTQTPTITPTITPTPSITPTITPTPTVTPSSNPFTFSLAGPAPLPGKYSDNFSLDISTDASGPYSTGIIYFNTDDPAPVYPDPLTMAIKDTSSNLWMTVNYLEQRFVDKQMFGFKFTPTGPLYIGYFPQGTLGVSLCTFP